MTARLRPSGRRALRVVQRNLLVYKHGWMVIFSGFFEPVFYLLSLGVGLGAMVRDVGGVNYAAFIAPGLLASSCMNGALTDGCFNIFVKMRFKRTYEGILATPLRIPDVALGEVLWAAGRGTMYSAAFLMVVLVLGVVRGQPILLSGSAVFAFPAAILVALSFSSMALLGAAYVTRIDQFDVIIGLVMTPMFLFSGVFFPVSQLPPPAGALLQLVPMYHAVELLRQLTTGAVRISIVWHAAFLMGAGVIALAVAAKRLERTLVA